MSVDVDEFELKIDGVDQNDVLDKIPCADDMTVLECFKNSFYPLTIPDRDYMSDEKIIEEVSKLYPKSVIFFRIVTDYGETAYEHKNGVTRELKKGWS